jgi:hypothetical protein
MKAATKRAKTKSSPKKALSNRAATKSPGKADAPELTKVYDALCAILKPYEKRLNKKEYGENFYYLETHDAVYRGKPMCTAACVWARTM